MPTHTKVMPKNLRESIAHFESLVISIEEEMDGIRVPNGNSTRWQIASASLYLATQHAEVMCMLIRHHDNEAAGLHLRALFEIYVRLAYILSKDDNSRLVAVLYADAAKYKRQSDEAKDSNKKALKAASSPEEQAYLVQLNDKINSHIKQTKEQEREYHKQLASMNHEEFLDENGKLKSGHNLSEQLNIRYMCKLLQYDNGMNLLGEYASIYGTLSMYAHISTVYLVKMVHKQPNGSIRIGTMSDEENEESSIRNIAAAHHYLAGIFSQCLREKGLSQEELDDKLSTLEDSKSKYDEFLTI